MRNFSHPHENFRAFERGFPKCGIRFTQERVGLLYALSANFSEVATDGYGPILIHLLLLKNQRLSRG